MEHTILIVEDEKGIRETVTVFLKNQGYNVLQASNGEEGLALIEANEIHLAVVVIFLSAKSEDIDKITGLNIGGDDYITKPFEAMELIARVNSNLRRYNQILALKENRNLNNNQQRLVVGGLELDKFTKEVFVNDRGVRLTAKEFQILELLMSYPGRVYSAEEIYEAVWKEEAINTETIMVHVRKLREKIEANPKKPEYLKVVWGIGYKIEKGV